MSMSWQELRKEAYDLSVSDKLALVEAIIRSLQNELRPRPPLPEGLVNEMIGLAKIDAPSPIDAEVEGMLEERLEEKYLK
ncbi:hypothetical protein OGM63_12120 [Plectonema radiosum NIES-515]|uniref:Plasmid stability protein n=1 Tax=Plectonema radiosum NIES-515 TaxID=2986073 RepID=A0ABT3AYP3_9CYAN|nr:hypothetical protein [Plectonema radiosum]MCV3214248.1 hypothetical protein [Plectonema radiosum NIES-515]